MQRTFDLLPHKLSVLALTAWLREHDCEGRYVWVEAADEKGIEALRKAIEKANPQAIGFSLVTEEFMANYKLIEQIKDRFPQIPIIVGGPHSTALPYRTLADFPAIDFIVVGEGELTVEELLKAIAANSGADTLGKIKGIGFRDELTGIFMTEPRPCIDDINILPDPAYDLILDPDSPPDRSSTFPLVCSYGCYFSCTFCSVPHGHYRCITPQRVVDRIERLQKQYGVEYFAIRDSFWPPKREWLDDFLQLLDKRELKIRFHFQTRAGALGEEHFRKLKRLGAQAIAIGVESGDSHILRSIKKGITVDQAVKTFKDLNKAGIFSIAFFIFGNKGENRQTIKTSISISHELNGSIAFFHVLYPLPGAEAFLSLSEEQKDWWKTGQLPSICGLTVPELESLARDAFIRYPLRKAYVRQHILHGALDLEFRLIARRIFLIHLRKFVLGMIERFPPARIAIRAIKRSSRRT
jgi:anaerobic magnesium-protoporphyrin IX monomethyl ester cyclase